MPQGTLEEALTDQVMQRLRQIGMIALAGLLLSSCGTPALNQASAAIACQNIVKEKLSSPSTAKFPSLSESMPTETANGYQWSSWVDAQNALGATVRTQFNCALNSKSGDIKRDQATVVVGN